MSEVKRGCGQWGVGHSGRVIAVLLARVGTFHIDTFLTGCDDDGSGSSSPAVPTQSPTPLPTQVAGPGLKSEVLDAMVASDPAGEVSVTFTVTDDLGIPLTATTSSAQNDQQA